MKSKYSEKKIADILSSTSCDPRKEWSSDMKKRLREIAADGTVTKNDLPRTQGMFQINLFNYLHMNSATKIVVVIIVAFGGILLLGGGAVWASDDSKPGDFLHGVDLAVESVNRVLASGVAASAEFELDVMDERVDELEELEAEDADSSDVEDALELVTEQQERVRERIAEMQELGAGVEEGEKERVMTRYENQLETHLEVMYQLQNEARLERYGKNVTDFLEDALDEYEVGREQYGREDSEGDDDNRYGDSDEQGEGIQDQDRDQDQGRTNMPEDSASGEGSQYGQDDSSDVEDMFENEGDDGSGNEQNGSDSEESKSPKGYQLGIRR